MKKDKLIEEMCTAKGNENNTIDLNAYARGLIDMYDKLKNTEDRESLEPELREAMLDSGSFVPVSPWTEIRNDFEDNGFIHIDAWTTEDGDENGTVIAKINVVSAEIIYLDERAKTDKIAQQAINEAIYFSTKKGLEL